MQKINQVKHAFTFERKNNYHVVMLHLLFLNIIYPHKISCN